MNWLVIPILLFIMLIIYVMVQQPKDISVTYPSQMQVEKTTSESEEPDYIIRSGKDIPKPIDTTMMDCSIDKRLTKKFEDKYFSPPTKDIDLDFPPYNIECCPFSKPMSTDLPVGNLPMCYAVQNKTHLKTKV